MPIARPPTSAAQEAINVALIRYPSVVAGVGGIQVGQAVAILMIGSQLQAVPCGSLPGGGAEQFAGFAAATTAPGSSVELIVGRGSLLTPIVEGAVPLVSGQEVYLAVTPGQVTQTSVIGVGRINLRLGYAASTTELVLTTDAYYQWGV